VPCGVTLSFRILIDLFAYCTYSVAEKESINKMSVVNLASIFGPILMKHDNVCLHVLILVVLLLDTHNYCNIPSIDRGTTTISVVGDAKFLPFPLPSLLSPSRPPTSLFQLSLLPCFSIEVDSLNPVL